MKTFKSSDLTHKRAEVMREAEKNGVIIQECRTNGEVVKEFVIVTRELMYETVDCCSLADGRSGNTDQLRIWHEVQPNNDTSIDRSWLKGDPTITRKG